MKKILFIADAASIHSHKWINYISRNSNFEVIWVSFNFSNYEFDSKISFIPLKKNLLINIFKVAKILFFGRPEIVHLHYVGYHSLLLLFKNKNSNLIINTWGSDLVFSNKNLVRVYWLRYLIKKSKFVISDAYHHFHFLKNYGLPESKFKYVPYGTDVGFFYPLNYPFRNREFVVIHTRALEDIYDLKTFLKAAKLVIEENQNFSFKITGSGSRMNQLEKYTFKHNIHHKVFFLGQLTQEDLLKEINNSDIYVSCSLRDGGIAGSTSEAMSCERLVIISNNSDNNLWINDGVNGFLFKNGDYKKLSRLIINATKDISKSLIIAKRGRDTIMKKNSYKKQMDKVIKIYSSIAFKS